MSIVAEILLSIFTQNSNILLFQFPSNYYLHFYSAVLSSSWTLYIVLPPPSSTLSSQHPQHLFGRRCKAMGQLESAPSVITDTNRSTHWVLISSQIHALCCFGCCFHLLLTGCQDSLLPQLLLCHRDLFCILTPSPPPFTAPGSTENER